MTNKIFGYIGFAILIIVLIYLILKVLGVFASPGYEEVLIAVLVGQVFYNGYAYRAIQEIDNRLKQIEVKI